MNTKKIRKVALIGLVVLFMGGTCALGYLHWEIQSGLNHRCEIAQVEHSSPGDNVGALLKYIQSESHSLKQRNLAVWALGQARDSRALPVLEGYRTGAECDHDQYLCQRELAKAIKLCKGETPNLLCIKTP